MLGVESLGHQGAHMCPDSGREVPQQHPWTDARARSVPSTPGEATPAQLPIAYL